MRGNLLRAVEALCLALWAAVAWCQDNPVLVVALQPTFFANPGQEVTITVTVRDAAGTAQPLEDVTLARVGGTQMLVGVTGADGSVLFTVRHDDPLAQAYEYIVRCRGVEQRVTVPVGQPVPTPDPAQSARDFLVNSPKLEPPAQAREDPALLAALRQGLGDILMELRADAACLVILRGPAQAQFVDAQGRRAGSFNGEPRAEIPGVQATTVAQAQWWRLPLAGRYQLTIEGTDADFGALVLVAPLPTGLQLCVFEDIPLDVGSRASVTIIDGSAQAVLTADGLLAPSVAGVIDTSAPPWTGPSPATQQPAVDLPADMRPVPLAPDCVVAQAVFCTGEDAEGRLTGVGTSFPLGTSQVGLYLSVRQAPPGTKLHLTWMHEGRVLRRQIIEAEGTGSSLTYLRAVGRPDLWPGQYAVIISQDERHIGTLHFAVQ